MDTPKEIDTVEITISYKDGDKHGIEIPNPEGIEVTLKPVYPAQFEDYGPMGPVCVAPPSSTKDLTLEVKGVGRYTVFSPLYYQHQERRNG
jgi:hypothetical protein